MFEIWDNWGIPERRDEELSVYWPSELRRSVTQPSRPRPSGPPQPVLSLVTSAVQGHTAVALTVQHSETIGRRKCSLPHPQSRPSASLSDQHLQVNKQCLMENPTQNEDKHLTHQRGGHHSISTIGISTSVANQPWWCWTLQKYISDNTTISSYKRRS